jgi:hypothetical protein
MRRLVQRVKLQPAPRVDGRALEFAGHDAGRDQSLQPPRERLPELIGHRRLPLLEARAPAHGKPGQEVIPVQRHRLLQRRRVRPRDQPLEVAHVDLHRPRARG